MNMAIKHASKTNLLIKIKQSLNKVLPNAWH